MVGFSLNTDILETNLINIAILIFGLVQFVGAALNDAMTERKQKIESSAVDSLFRLLDADLRYLEAVDNLEVTQSTIDKIQGELRVVKLKIIRTGTLRLYNELSTQVTTAELIIFLQKQKLLAQVKQQLLTLALKRAIFKVLVDLKPSQYAIAMETAIERIGEFKQLGGSR